MVSWVAHLLMDAPRGVESLLQGPTQGHCQTYDIALEVGVHSELHHLVNFLPLRVLGPAADRGLVEKIISSAPGYRLQ